MTIAAFTPGLFSPHVEDNQSKGAKKMKPTKPSDDERRLTELQIQEYVDRYYPEMGKVSVDLSPGGTIAIARRKSPADGSAQ